MQMRAKDTYMSNQNVNPLDSVSVEQDKPQTVQRKLISSSSSKPRNPYASKLDNYTQETQAPTMTEDDMRNMLANELRSHFENLREELVDNFSSMMRNQRNTGRIDKEEVHEIKEQIAHNRSKFEEIQNHIAQVNKQFANINTLYSQELEGIKQTVGVEAKSNLNGSQASAANELAQKELEMKFNMLRQELTGEIQSAVKPKSKQRLNEAIVSDLKQIKQSFEDDLRERFDTVNIRVKTAEENLNEIMKKKSDQMERIRDEFVVSLETQGGEITEEIKYLEKAIHARGSTGPNGEFSEDEIDRRMEPIKEELEKIKHTIFSCQDEIERITTQTQRNFDTLDQNVREKFTELEDQQPNETGNYLAKRVDRLDEESEIYHNAIAELRNNLREIQDVYRLLQGEPKFNKSDEVATRLEAKINTLQAQIQSLTLQAERQQATKSYTGTSSLPPLAENITRTTPSTLTASTTKIPSTIPATQTTPIAVQKVSTYQSTVREEIISSASKPLERNYESYTSSYQPKPVNSYSPYALSAGNNLQSMLRPEEEKAKMQSSSIIDNRTSPGPGAKKYYGDPKVKNIIDEFYQKKKSTTQSPMESLAGSRITTERALTSNVTTFSPTHQVPITSSYQPTSYQPTTYQPTSYQSELASNKKFDLDTNYPSKETYVSKAPVYPTYNYSEMPAPKWDPYRDINMSNVNKSLASNLSMSYSTVNPTRIEASPKTEDYASPRGTRREQDDESRPTITVQPASAEKEISILKKGAEQSMLSAQLLHPSNLPAPKVDQSVHSLHQRDTSIARDSQRRSVGGASVSAVDTDQFQDAVDYMSDFDLGEGKRGTTANQSRNSSPPTKIGQQINLTPGKRGLSDKAVKKDATNSNVKDQEGDAESKKVKHEKILAQIDFFIHGKISNVLNEDDDEEIFCNLDDEGYIFDEDGDFVLDKDGKMVKLTQDEIERFNKNNMIE